MKKNVFLTLLVTAVSLLSHAQAGCGLSSIALTNSGNSCAGATTITLTGSTADMNNIAVVNWPMRFAGYPNYFPSTFAQQISSPMGTLVNLSGVINPTNVVFDHAGNLYVRCNAGIMKFAHNSTTGTVVAQNQASGGQIAVDDNGNVYVASFNHVFEYPAGSNASTAPITRAFALGRSQNGAGSIRYWDAGGLAVHNDGSFLLGDLEGGRILRFRPNSTADSIPDLYAGSWLNGSAPPGPTIDNLPFYVQALVESPAGNLYVSGFPSSSVLKFGPNHIDGAGPLASVLGLYDPGTNSLWVDASENVYGFDGDPWSYSYNAPGWISKSIAGQNQFIAAGGNGQYNSNKLNSFSEFGSVAVDPISNDIYVCADGRILKFHQTTPITTAGSIATGALQFTPPYPGNFGAIIVTTTGCVTSVTSSPVKYSGPEQIINFINNPTICPGQNVSISPNVSSPAANTTYQWKLNSTVVSTAASYSNNTLQNGDMVILNVSTTDPCITPNTATDTVVVSVLSSPPSINISSSTGNSVCLGQMTTFTASATNAGTNATYAWFLNGQSVGVNSPTYSDCIFNTGDQIYCTLQTTTICGAQSSATSNTITVTNTCTSSSLWAPPSGGNNTVANNSNWSSGAAPSQCTDNAVVGSSNNPPVVDPNSSVDIGTLSMGNNSVLTIDNNSAVNICNTLLSAGDPPQILGPGKIVMKGSSQQIITGNIIIDYLTIDNSAGVKLSSGTILQVNKVLELKSGTFDISQGVLVFGSNSSSSSAILDNFSAGFTGVLSGVTGNNVKAQRFYDQSYTYNQHMMGSPLASSNGSTNGPSFAYFGANSQSGYVIPQNCDETQLASNSPYGNVYSLHEDNGASCGLSQWKVEQASGHAQVGVGYSVALTGSGTLSVTGAPNLNSSYTISGLTNSNWSNASAQGRLMNSGWSLLSNPYLASLNISTNNPGFDNQIQVWNCNGPFAGTYQPGTIGVDASVAPFQAFMVHETNPGGPLSYTLNASDRSTSVTTFYNSTSDHLTLNVKNEQTGMMDKTEISFNSNATDSFDRLYDANKLNGAIDRHMIYSTNLGQNLSRNTLSSINNNPSVGIGLQPGKTGLYSISFEGVNTFDPTVFITLEDLITGAFADVRDGQYVFSSTTNDPWNRFVLHFSPALLINTVDATCSSLGTINLEQPGTKEWNFTLSDNSGNILSNGVINQASPFSYNSAAGSYLLTLTDANGYTVSKTIVVGGSNAPIAAFTSSATTIQPFQNVTVTSSTTNAQQYSWDFGDGTFGTGLTATHSYSNSGIYIITLSITAANGCVSSETMQITVNTAVVTGTSTNQTTPIKTWSTGNTVFVDLGQTPTSAVDIAIYNVLGQEISNEKCQTAFYTKSINLTDLSCVVVKVQNESTLLTRKLLIEKQ